MIEKADKLKDLRKKHLTPQTKLVWIDSVPYGIKVSQRIKVNNEKLDARLRKEGGTNQAI